MNRAPRKWVVKLSILLSALAIAAMTACGGGGGGSTPNGGTGSLQGWVYAPVGSGRVGSGESRTASAAPPGYQPLQGASVTLTGGYSATTNTSGKYTFTGIPEGTYTITITADGFDTIRIYSVSVQEGSTTTPMPEGSDDYVLTPDESGSLRVYSTPTGAAISIDGFSTGFTTNHEFKNMTLGQHEVTVSLAGYTTPPAQSVTITSSHISSVTFDLWSSGGSEDVVEVFNIICGAYNSESVSTIMSHVAAGYTNSLGEDRTEYQQHLTDFFAVHSNGTMSCDINDMEQGEDSAEITWNRSGGFTYDEDRSFTDLTGTFQWTFTLSGGNWLLLNSTALNSENGSISGRGIVSDSGDYYSRASTQSEKPQYPENRGKMVYGPDQPAPITPVHRIQPLCQGTDFVPGELIVHFSSAQGARKTASASDLIIKEESPDGSALVGIPTGGSARTASSEETVNRCLELNGKSGIRFADLNRIRRPMATPNDPLYPQQWHYNLINLPQAWDISTGSSSVIVAVLDTGITTNSDVNSRVISGYDFIGGDTDPTDDMTGIPEYDPRHSGYHGTHVSGTIGAVTNNNLGVAGVTWSNPILIVRVLGPDGGTEWEETEGIKYASRLSNSSGRLPSSAAKVINMSLGGSGYCTTTEQETMDASIAAGVVIVAATGNDSGDINSPANCDGVIAVGAVDLNSQLSDYSNYGSEISVVAPGGSDEDGVLSTVRNDYADYMGTSMATPHVAGVAALIRSVNSSLTPVQVKQILENTATDLGSNGFDVYYGHGMINAYKALQQAQGSTSLTPIIGVSPSSLNFGTSKTSLDILVYNSGGGTLVIQTPTKSGDLSASWMTLSTSNETDGLRIAVTVNRNSLSNATYNGTILIQSNGGSASVPVSMTVSSAPVTGDDIGTVYFLAVDAENYDTAAQDSSTYANNYEYSIVGLQAGEYYVVGGTDLDDDDYICESDEGEACGWYPIDTDPQTVTVYGQSETSGIDFPIIVPFVWDRASSGLPDIKLKINKTPKFID